MTISFGWTVLRFRAPLGCSPPRGPVCAGQTFKHAAHLQRSFRTCRLARNSVEVSVVAIGCLVSCDETCCSGGREHKLVSQLLGPPPSTAKHWLHGLNITLLSSLASLLEGGRHRGTIAYACLLPSGLQVFDDTNPSGPNAKVYHRYLWCAAAGGSRLLPLRASRVKCAVRGGAGRVHLYSPRLDTHVKVAADGLADRPGGSTWSII